MINFKKIGLATISVMLLTAILCQAFLIPAGAEDTRTLTEKLLADFPLKSINYNYSSVGISTPTTESASVFYSHALLSLPFDSLSPDLAKASVALAMAAYDRYHVRSLLSAMGFDYDDNSDVYDRSKNELTLEDNNYVAYTIAYKEWTDPATDETYVFYCIPIKGTTANAEWFSNFDLGEGDQHNGFTVATLEIYYKLLAKFSNDNATDDDHRKVLLTGHSRGAACANLLAGWLSGELISPTSEKTVTAYTFACPAVSINAKSTYKNIYSFNNPGDLVAMMPLKSWDYKRNGQAIELDTSYSQYDNMQIQFQSTTGDTYEGLRSGDTYDILLTNLLGDDRDIYYDSATLQLTVDIIAWALGGSGDVNFIEIAKKHFGGLPGKLNTLELLLEAAIGITDLASLSIHINTKAGQQDLLAECAYNAYIQSQNMTAEEFSEYLTNPDIRDLISEIKIETGLTVTVSYDFYLISRALDDTAYDAISIAQCIDAARELICDENGNILYKISHAHSQALYTTWINSMYYGYRGWTGNDSSEIQNVTLSENMYSVGQSCFEGCSSVESVVIDNAEQCIGSNAFANCSSLKYLTLPADHRINHDPFSQSSNLSVLIYTKGKTGVISDRTAMNYSGMLEYRLRDRVTTVMLNEGITHIGNHAFRGGPNGNNIRTVIFPESLKSIGEYSFTYCTLLEECDLPDSVSSLGRNCFAYCSSLSSIDIPASLDTIPQYCFYECDGITDLYIPENITTVCDRAFAMCSGLQKLTITYPYVSLESNSFASCTSLTELIWPSECSHTTNAFAGTTGIESIVYTANGNGIMQNRTASNYTSAPEYISRICLTEVTFEEGVKHIGSYTFYNNRESNSLKSVFLPSTLESIGEYTFYSCNELKECTLPDSVNTLGKYCFAYCTSLTSNHIPTSLTTIPQYCFYDCDAITEIYIPANVTLVAERAFNTCSGLQKLTIYSPSVSLSDSSFGSCASLNELIWPAECTHTTGAFTGTTGIEKIKYTFKADGVMQDRTVSNYEKTPEYESRNSLKTVIFEDGITHIGSYTFYTKGNGNALKNISFSNALESIGNYAFAYCQSLEECNLPDSVNTLGSYCFAYCSSLNSIHFPKSLDSIPSYCFQSCNGFITLTIPDTIATVSQCAFNACANLQKLTITNPQTNLEINSFNSCTSLKELIWPAECNHTTQAFQGVSSIEKITYTFNSDGVMQDRTMSNYGHAPEYPSRNSITEVVFEEGVKHIGAYTFYTRGYGNNLTSVTLPSTLESIGDFAFSHSEKLTECLLPEGLTTLGKYTFADCTSLESIHFPSTLETIPQYCFSNCSALTELFIPETVTAIEAHAFQQCSGLQKITVTYPYISLGSHCFSSCSSLKELIWPAECNHTSDAFGNTISIEKIVYTCKADGVMQDRTSGNYHLSPESKSRKCLTTVIFEEGITHLGNYTFHTDENDSVLSTVTLPSTLESIGNYAFAYCTSLNSITLPENLSTIGSYCFLLSNVSRICFLGDAPVLASNALYSLAATVYYPANNSTWNEDTLLQYGGNITWVESEAPVHVHSLQYFEAKAPTCTDIGWDFYEICLECDHTTYVEFAATGHSYADGVCNICGEADPDHVIPDPELPDVQDIIIGDVNGDGVVNGKDSNALKKILSGAQSATEHEQFTADVDRNGLINGVDANYIARFISGNISDFS